MYVRQGLNKDVRPWLELAEDLVRLGVRAHSCVGLEEFGAWHDAVCGGVRRGAQSVPCV